MICDVYSYMLSKLLYTQINYNERYLKHLT